MRKVLALFLVMSLTAGLLAGCTKAPSETTAAGESETPSETEKAESEAPASTEAASTEAPTTEAPATEAPTTEEASKETETPAAEKSDQKLADEAAALIDAIYVQKRTDDTDEQCTAAKAAWDALTDEQKELVEGEFADPDYFGRDTGDASKDDPRNADDIGENELLVVSFGTSFNDSRAEDIGGIEKALE